MQRSTGVTVSAIIAFLGSGCVLMLAAFSVASALFLHRQRPQSAFPMLAIFFVVVLYTGLAVWGTLTGVGLIRLREWARISTLVFSAFLLLISIGGFFGFLVIVRAVPVPETLPPNFWRTFSIIMGFIYMAPAIIAAWWLYFFTRSRITSQFREVLAEHKMGPIDSAVDIGTTTSVHAPIERPVSIAIISCYSIFSGCISVLAVPFVMKAAPIMVFGYLLPTPLGIVYLSLFGAALIASGIGLWRLKPWARSLAILVFIFMILNATASLVMPGSLARMHEARAIVQQRWGLAAGMPAEAAHNAFAFTGAIEKYGLYFGNASALILGALQLWFVVRRKNAFDAQASA